MSRRDKDRQAAARLIREQRAHEQRRQRTVWVSVGAVVVLLLAGLIGWGVYSSQQVGEYTAPKSVASDDDSGLPVGSGPKTVDIYLDYLCPACKQYEDQVSDTLDRLVAENKITLVYHPLGFLDELSSNEYSTRSAAAAGCASDEGRLVEYTKALYADQPAENGPGHTDAKLIQIGEGAGLGNGFATCVRDKTYVPWVRHVNDRAEERGVRGTPTIYVDGKQIRTTLDALNAAVG